MIGSKLNITKQEEISQNLTRQLCDQYVTRHHHVVPRCRGFCKTKLGEHNPSQYLHLTQKTQNCDSLHFGLKSENTNIIIKFSKELLHSNSFLGIFIFHKICYYFWGVSTLYFWYSIFVRSKLSMPKDLIFKDLFLASKLSKVAISRKDSNFLFGPYSLAFDKKR